MIETMVTGEGDKSRCSPGAQPGEVRQRLQDEGQTGPGEWASRLCGGKVTLIQDTAQDRTGQTESEASEELVQVKKEELPWGRTVEAQMEEGEEGPNRIGRGTGKVVVKPENGGECVLSRAACWSHEIRRSVLIAPR